MSNFRFPQILWKRNLQGIFNENSIRFIAYIITFSLFHDKYFYPSKSLVLYIFYI